MKRISTLVMSLALFIGCGLPERADIPQPSTGVQALTTPVGVVGSVEENEQKEPVLHTPTDSKPETQSSYRQCCFGQCSNPGRPWTGKFNWGPGEIDYGNCGPTVRGYCAGRGYSLYHAFWDPCS